MRNVDEPKLEAAPEPVSGSVIETSSCRPTSSPFGASRPSRAENELLAVPPDGEPVCRAGNREWFGDRLFADGDTRSSCLLRVIHRPARQLSHRSARSAGRPTGAAAPAAGERAAADARVRRGIQRRWRCRCRAQRFSRPSAAAVPERQRRPQRGALPKRRDQQPLQPVAPFRPRSS